MNASLHYDYEILFNDESIGEGATAAKKNVQNVDVSVVYIMGCSEYDARELAHAINKIPQVRAEIGAAWRTGVFDVHVTHMNASKYGGVLQLWSLLGLIPEGTLGVGDGENDLSLFDAVGIRAAVAGGSEILERRADFLCGAVSEDGIGELFDLLSTIVSARRF